jgi:single-stranded DNA-binding protein
MTAQTTKKTFPATRFDGRLTGDPVERFIPSKTEGKPATPVLEFDIALNPTREGLETLYVKASIVGAKRVESAKTKLAKGAAVEVAGDLKVRSYIHESKPRTSVELEVAFGKVVIFGNKGEAPTKTSLFATESASAE